MCPFPAHGGLNSQRWKRLRLWAHAARRQQQQIRREDEDTDVAGETSEGQENESVDVIGSSLAFDDAAQVDFEITAASTLRARTRHQASMSAGSQRTRIG